MEALDGIAEYLAPETGQALRALGKTRRVVNVRLRPGQPVRAEWLGGDAPLGGPLTARMLEDMLSVMLRHSLYAWENELGEGYFTLPGGCRAGVAGRFAREGGRVRLAKVGSVCVRVARAEPGSAEELLKRIQTPAGVASAVLLAPPGAGKTTILRDAARLLAEGGRRVAIADERGELAACREGVPTLDVGPRTDVIDGLPKALAIPRLVRAMAPEVVIADEIGGPRDGQALREAARMGVSVLASAHAGSLADALRRPALREILSGGGFSRAVLLAAPGRIVDVWQLDGKN